MGTFFSYLLVSAELLDTHNDLQIDGLQLLAKGFKNASNEGWLVPQHKTCPWMAVRVNSPFNEVMFGEQHGYSLEDSLGRPTSTRSCCEERQYSPAIDRVVDSELWEQCYPDRIHHCGNPYTRVTTLKLTRPWTCCWNKCNALAMIVFGAGRYHCSCGNVQHSELCRSHTCDWYSHAI